MREWLEKNKYKLIFLSLLVINILVWNFYFSLPQGFLRVKFFDVGQGDAIYIQTALGYRILIDGGANDKVVDYLGEELPFYSKRIDLLILTHPDADHLTGLVNTLKTYQIDQIWINGDRNDTRIYSDWEQALKNNQGQQIMVKQGDQLIFPDSTKLKVLWPRPEFKGKNLNERSIVVHLEYGEFDALLTGDADSPVQPYTSDSSHVELFKVPHHGSRTAINESYLRSISPEVSVISVGAKNPYGHPHPDLLKQLKDQGTQILRTDQESSIEIVSDGSSWYTKSQ